MGATVETGCLLGRPTCVTDIAIIIVFIIIICILITVCIVIAVAVAALVSRVVRF